MYMYIHHYCMYMSMHMYMYMHRCILLLVQVKFLCAVVCVTLLDRLQGDQVITFSGARMHLRVSTLINPRRACAARVTVVVLSVCLSVTTFSAATRNKTANK